MLLIKELFYCLEFYFFLFFIFALTFSFQADYMSPGGIKVAAVDKCYSGDSD